MKKFLRSGLVLGGILALCATAAAGEALREGDIVFSSSNAGQGGAIIAATGSPYTHCGIMYRHAGKLMVLEAVQPVGVVTLEQFKSRSAPGTFMARRLKSAVTPANYRKALDWAAAQIGRNYDSRFLWDDSNLYCSELVWKIYRQAGVELCPPRRFGDYRLHGPEVEKVIAERFGGIENLPRDEKVVAPSDLAASPLLVPLELS